MGDLGAAPRACTAVLMNGFYFADSEHKQTFYNCMSPMETDRKNVASHATS